MLIHYDETTDVLRLRFSGARVSRNKSSDPLIETWFDGDDRLLEITVHAANAKQHWPINEVQIVPRNHNQD